MTIMNPAQQVSAAKATELIDYGSPKLVSKGYAGSVHLVFMDSTESLRLVLNEDGSFGRLDLWETEGESPLEGSFDSDWMDVSEGEFGGELKDFING